MRSSTTNKSLLLLLLWCIASVQTQYCGNANPATDLIDAGKVSLVRRGGTREHCFSVPVNYNIPNTGRSPDIAVSIVRLQGYNTNGGYDFSVSAGRKGLTNAISINVQINEDVRWASLDVSYLVSSNTNFIAGTFIANMYPLTSCASDLTSLNTNVETYVPTYRLNQGLTYKVVAYISGFRTLDNSFQVKAVTGSVDKVDGRVVIQVMSNAVPGLQYIYLTYFVYPATAVNNFNFAVNSLNQASTYKLQGMTSALQSGIIQYSQFTICSRVGCPNNQVFVNGACGCDQNYFKINQICRQLCTMNGYINDNRLCVCIDGYQKNPQGSCVPVSNIPNCRQNQVFQNGVGCVCVQGFTKNQQGICQPNRNQCTGANQVRLSNGQCGCVAGYYRSNNFCLSICTGQNQVWSGQVCNCAPGFTRNNINQPCVQIQCGVNEIVQNNACICPPGFARNPFGVCLPPPTVNCPNQNEVNVGGSCQCQGGFYRGPMGICIPTNPSCGSGQVYNPNSMQCQCKDGYIKNGLVCMPRCAVNYQWVNNRCVCNNGFAQIRGSCLPCPSGSQVTPDFKSCTCFGNTVFKSDTNNLACVACPARSSPQNNQCVCSTGLIWNNDRSACIDVQVQNCPPNSVRNNYNGCSCIQNYQWNTQGTACNPPCQQNSSPDGQGNCVCNNGYSLSGTTCVLNSCPPNSFPNGQGGCNCFNNLIYNPVSRTCNPPSIACPQGAFPSPQGICTCSNGLYLSDNQCKPIPSCPLNSQWDQTNLKCTCTIANQYLINNVCRTCGNNQIWNSTDCVCSPGYYRIAGICRTCDINTSYNGTDCICNIGYFGTRDKCNKCHSTCGRCSGDQASNCITCVDVTFTLANGYCTQSSPCPVGNYLNGSVCAKCSDYCQVCATELQCAQCAPGFQISLTVIDGLGYSACSPICGDGRRVDIQQCDDNNTISGDGCSSTCMIQSGWTCVGGTSISRSVCTKGVPPQSVLQVKGSVNTIGKVVQGVRLSYIPKCFTDKDCIDCFKILDVKVIQSAVPVGVTVSYIPNSNGQFLVQYNLGGIISNTYFSSIVQLNQNLPAQYKTCFTAADYAQQIVTKIDTATLALSDNTSSLSLSDLTNPSTTTNPVNNNTASNNGTVLGYPKKIIDKLFQ